jgi:hypothetical protein
MTKRVEIHISFQIYQVVVIAAVLVLAAAVGLALPRETPVARDEMEVPLLDPSILEYEYPLQKISRYELTIKEVIQRSLFLVFSDQTETEETRAFAFALAASIHEDRWATFTPEEIALIQYAVPQMWGADVIARMNEIAEGLIE